MFHLMVFHPLFTVITCTLYVNEMWFLPECKVFVNEQKLIAKKKSKVTESVSMAVFVSGINSITFHRLTKVNGTY